MSLIKVHYQTGDEEEAIASAEYVTPPDNRFQSSQFMRRRQSLSLFNIAYKKNEFNPFSDQEHGNDDQDADQPGTDENEDSEGAQLSENATQALILRNRSKFKLHQPKVLHVPPPLGKASAATKATSSIDLAADNAIMLLRKQKALNSKLCFTTNTYENYYEQRSAHGSLSKRASFKAIRDRTKMNNRMYLVVFMLVSLSILSIAFSFYRLINKL